MTNAVGQPIIKVSKTTSDGVANSITQVENAHGGLNRNYYDANGKWIMQISNNDHGYPKDHQFGMHGEHTHDIIW